MSGYRFRAMNPRTWVLVLAIVVYGLGLVAILFTSPQWTTAIAGENRMLRLALTVALTVPLLGVLWFLSPEQEIHLTEGKVTLTNGRTEVARIRLQDISRLHLTTPQNRLQIFDWDGECRINTRSLTGPEPIQATITFLRARLPHDIRRVKGRLTLTSRMDTYIDVTPPAPQ